MKAYQKEQGSISLFVLVALLFFVILLTSIYITTTNNQGASEEFSKRNLERYEKDVNQIDSVYDQMALDYLSDGSSMFELFDATGTVARQNTYW